MLVSQKIRIGARRVLMYKSHRLASRKLCSSGRLRMRTSRGEVTPENNCRAAHRSFLTWQKIAELGAIWKCQVPCVCDLPLARFAQAETGWSKTCESVSIKVLMPGDPGRFKSTGAVKAVTRDQQVNPGWQGPRLCSNYASLWIESFPPNTVHFSEWVLCAQDSLHPDVGKNIELALVTLETVTKPSKGAGSKKKAVEEPKGSDVPILPLPTIPSYGTPQGRSKLAQVLKAFCCWNPRCGFNPIMASLAARIMAVTGNERGTFNILVTIYRRYQLKDYFEGTAASQAEHLMQDAEAVWQSVGFEWPDLVTIFSQFTNGCEIFNSCVKSLLSSMLTKTYAPEAQLFEWHVRLLHHILLPIGEYSKSDPRAQLRHIVMQIMARHLHNFRKCRDEHELQQAAKNITRHVHVDVVLVTLLCRAPTPPTAHLAPSFMAGFLGGSTLGTVSYEVACHFLPSLGAPVQVLLGLTAAVAGSVGSQQLSMQLSMERAVDGNRAVLTSSENTEEEAEFNILDSCVVF